MNRDFEKNPYTSDEQKVCDYIQEITNNVVGCGDDPISFLIASHRLLMFNAQKANQFQKEKPKDAYDTWMYREYDERKR